MQFFRLDNGQYVNLQRCDLFDPLDGLLYFEYDPTDPEQDESAFLFLTQAETARLQTQINHGQQMQHLLERRVTA